MTKSETLKQLAAASNAARLAEPLAQAMAALTDETRQTLTEIAQQSREQGEKFQRQIEVAAKAWQDAAAQTHDAAESLNQAGRRMEWRHYLLALMTGLCTAMLVSAFWLWLAPPSVINRLDPQAVAEYLRPEIAAVKRSNGK
jgi:ABC-type transporter Mla subunit MlaD